MFLLLWLDAFRTGIAVLDPQQRSTLGDLIVAGDERLQEALDSFESRLAIEPLRRCCGVCVCLVSLEFPLYFSLFYDSVQSATVRGYSYSFR